MKIYCAANSSGELCLQVLKVSKQKGQHFVKRPWNRFEPESTNWWLVPSSDWPSYKHGKFYFENQPDDSLFCGLYIEKGLDPSVASAYTSPKGLKHIMDVDWMWFRLLLDYDNRFLAALIEGIGRRIQSPIEFEIDGGYVKDPGNFDPQEVPRYEWDNFLLRWRPADNKFNLVEARGKGNILGCLAKVKTFKDFYNALNELNGNSWAWVDVFIAIRLYTGSPINKGRDEFWSQEDIWDKFLIEFLPLVQTPSLKKNDLDELMTSYLKPQRERGLFFHEGSALEYLIAILKKNEFDGLEEIMKEILEIIRNPEFSKCEDVGNRKQQAYRIKMNVINSKHIKFYLKLEYSIWYDLISDFDLRNTWVFLIADFKGKSSTNDLSRLINIEKDLIVKEKQPDQDLHIMKPAFFWDCIINISEEHGTD